MRLAISQALGVKVLGKWREEALRGPGIWVSEEAVYVPGLSASSCPHSLKVEYDKLANEKTEMQRHYVMGLFLLVHLTIEKTLELDKDKPAGNPAPSSTIP
ncbi:transducin-like enhancer protein 3-like isoform 2 [Cricetulus griseus]|nr:transducin-like enhancer protein 3-like isoform 2 [Cricetulus griseus]